MKSTYRKATLQDFFSNSTPTKNDFNQENVVIQSQRKQVEYGHKKFIKP